LYCMLHRSRLIKVLCSSILVVLALWIATPKIYIHSLLNHDHSAITTGGETQIKQQSPDDCDFEKYNKPAYFNIFRFISSFLPVKPQHSMRLDLQQLFLSDISAAISLLRAPPVSR
jgi:hypothetical protein